MPNEPEMLNIDPAEGKSLDAPRGAVPTKPASRVREPNRLLWHIYITYFWLRSVMGVLAIVFPVVVVAIFWFLNRDQGYLPSLSHYHDQGVAGRIFTGTLFAVGMSLFMYQGFSRDEDHALNVAGVCALIVGLVPRDSAFGDFGLLESNELHFGAAVTLFLLLIYVAVFCAKHTLVGYTHERQKRFKRAYVACAAAMLVFIALAIVLGLYGYEKWVIAAEAFGIWGFGAFWIVKSHEMKLRTERDRRIFERV